MIQTEILDRLRSSPLTGRAFRKFCVEAMSEIPSFNWTGIYRLDGDMLVLEDYVGDATDHTEIPVGRGVCGTAVAENRNQVIEDVRELSNYLSCSVKTRSEIVVLIRGGDRILAQIDIDGHEVGAFRAEDERFLDDVATLIADRWQEKQDL